jgi:tetratricopeptide (TPR) repeat protein
MSEKQDLEFVLAASRACEYQRVVARGSAVIESGANASSIVMLYADALLELDRTSEAREAFKLALRILPVSRHRRIFDALAALELHADRYVAAEEYCHQAIALAPDHASAHIYLGIVYENTDRSAEAEAEFTRGTACTDGAIDEAWYNLGRVQSMRGRTLEAAISFRRALAIDPEYELAHEALGGLEEDRHGAHEA